MTIYTELDNIGLLRLIICASVTDNTEVASAAIAEAETRGLSPTAGNKEFVLALKAEMIRPVEGAIDEPSGAMLPTTPFYTASMALCPHGGIVMQAEWDPDTVPDGMRYRIGDLRSLTMEVTAVINELLKQMSGNPVTLLDISSGKKADDPSWRQADENRLVG